MGIYFYSDYYVATSETYKNSFVFYERFVYDLISMFGLNLFYIELPTLELLLRRLYRAVSFQQKGKVRLRRMEDITVAFTQQEFEEAIYAKQKMDNTSVEINVSTKMLLKNK